MAHEKVRFAKREANFIPEVKSEVRAYFEQRGISQHANARMVAKTVILLVVTYGSYALILTQLVPLWGMLGLAVLMGIGMAGIGFSVSHDALHGAYSSSPRINRILGFTFDLNGANGYMWKITHNVIHHTYTNIEGVDEDLTVAVPFLRLAPGTQRYWYHRFQHFYAFLAYALATVNWIFVKDYQQFMKKDIGPYTNKKHPRSEWIHLFWTKFAHYGYTIVIPLLVLDITWWQFLIGFLAMHLTAGVILGVVFQLAHVVEGPEFPMPDTAGRIDEVWLIHEMHTTANFAHGNRLLSWYVGGLNYQIEHHLFPQICSIHYPHISGIVRRVAERNGVPYYSHTTLRDAVRSHRAMLRKLGRPESETQAPYAA